MASTLQLITITVLVAFCSTSAVREKRQTYGQPTNNYGQPTNNYGQPTNNYGQGTAISNGQGYNCQGDGAFPNQQDCSTFYQCFDGVATVLSCPAGLEFNANTRQCDYPLNIPQGSCQRTSNANAVNEPCLARGNAKGVYFVQHPTYCNAFFTCGNGFLYAPCTFCVYGQFFNPTTGRCENVRNEAELQSQCSGRNFIPPEQQEISRLDASCRPGQGNVFQALINKVRGGGYPSQNNNNGYPSNNGYQNTGYNQARVPGQVTFPGAQNGYQNQAVPRNAEV